MNKHTPGPWLIEQTTVYALNSERIQVNRFTASIDRGWGDNGARILQQEVEANTRLISAAPDLLEALEMIVSEADSYTARTGKPVYNWLDQARSAIARARGAE